MMQRISRYISLAAIAIAIVACNSDKTTPGYTFMDDMYISPALETYATTTQFANGLTAQLPVAGTVPRGYTVYEYENTPEGYEMAKVGLMMPAEYMNEETIAEGKELYTMFCGHCHGDKGDGNGHLVEIGKFPPVPDYKSREITAGSIYHVIMYGKNLMGSHASQLTDEERWKITRYVQELRGDNVVATPDTTEEVATEVEVEETIDQHS